MDLGAAQELAVALLARHGLSSWTFRFDRAKTRAGACHGRDRVISLSRHVTLLHDEAEVRDTILHEIAHALAGPGHGHDEVWRAAAQSIGGSGLRCVSPDAPRVEGPWQGRCPAGHTATRHRAPTRVLLCRRCEGGPAERLIEWTLHGRTVPMHPGYVTELQSVIAGVRHRRGDRLEPGQVVRVAAPGRYLGATGPIVKRGRTCYHVRFRGGLLRVPFSLVEPAG
ncbi:MAG: SprT-like domain-containing protein [Terracoccus sp.]